MLKPTNQTTSRLLGFIQHLVPSIQSQADRDEIYLCGAVDIYDLERRMREIDGRNSHSQSTLPLGLGLR